MRWGILGTAQISLELIKAANLSGQCEVQAVASRDPGRAKDWARRHGIPLSYGSYEDLLGSGQVDLIYNPLPNSLHAEWTIKALEAGYPVLCEKPLSAGFPQRHPRSIRDQYCKRRATPGGNRRHNRIYRP